MKDKNNTLTWLQINNLLPIITSVILIALSWGALNTRLAVLENKMDNMITLLKSHEEQQLRLITDLNQVHKELIALQTAHPNNQHSK
jgi:hypothetical protein